MLPVRRHQISFKHALNGLLYTTTSQPNFRVHLGATIIALFLGFYLKITRTDWLILVFTISLVLIAETVNTSIESMTDLLSAKYHQKAKIAKDTSAGMVLLSALASVIIGLIIFLPYLID